MSEHNQRHCHVRIQPDEESRRLAERVSGKEIAKRVEESIMFSGVVSVFGQWPSRKPAAPNNASRKK